MDIELDKLRGSERVFYIFTNLLVRGFRNQFVSLEEAVL